MAASLNYATLFPGMESKEKVKLVVHLIKLTLRLSEQLLVILKTKIATTKFTSKLRSNITNDVDNLLFHP